MCRKTRHTYHCDKAARTYPKDCPVQSFRRQAAGWGCNMPPHRFADWAKHKAACTGNVRLRHCLPPSGEMAARQFVKSARAQPTGGIPPPALQVVSKCALRDKRNGTLGFPNAPRLSFSVPFHIDSPPTRQGSWKIPVERLFQG